MHITRVVKSPCGTQKNKRGYKNREVAKKYLIMVNHNFADEEICSPLTVSKMKKKTTWVREKKLVFEVGIFWVLYTGQLRNLKVFKLCVHGLYSIPTRDKICVCFIATQKSVWSNLIGHVTSRIPNVCKI